VKRLLILGGIHAGQATLDLQAIEIKGTHVFRLLIDGNQC
jgi:hypothetical protein